MTNVILKEITIGDKMYKMRKINPKNTDYKHKHQVQMDRVIQAFRNKNVILF